LRRAAGEAPWQRYGLAPGGYGLVTLHRPSNVDHPAQLDLLLAGLGRIGASLPLLWPIHPRTRRRMAERTLPIGLEVVEPVGYRDMALLLDRSAVVITDSGGLQEESTALGVPCVTLRESTERPITVTHGTNRLVPWPPSAERIAASVGEALAGGRARTRTTIPGWDGEAAVRIVEAMERAEPGAALCREDAGREQRAAP